ncbi:D site-binding protein-like [Haemorhous mexicanus]|uniref:D site-binding protein-like n=1 Tax=Haemorhous mexicanus TaxID=30427 RepID=UPI0028BE444A|nr:D site-binding protein-like [Haemorhous mexicanus]
MRTRPLTGAAPPAGLGPRAPGGTGAGMEEPGGSRGGFLGVPPPPPPWERPGPPPAPIAGGGPELEYVDLDEFLREHGLPPPSPPRSPEPERGPPPQIVAAPLCRDRSSPNAPPRARGVPPLGIRPLSRQPAPYRDSPAPDRDGNPAAPRSPGPPPGPPGGRGGGAGGGVPGGGPFDPRRLRFSQEELRPQPIARKARKVHVPEEQKDEKYWSRRSRNNAAAKRSRDARRLKENQISVRAAFLERENAALRLEVAAARRELQRFRAILARYEARHGQI